jgi:alkyl sulfatase BDS1-like metallo-beta-lactamase superfamily hydrolase
MVGMVTGTIDAAAALSDGSVTVEGDPGVLAALVGLVAPTDPDFDIVTP